jgi:hypothetical protein
MKRAFDGRSQVAKDPPTPKWLGCARAQVGRTAFASTPARPPQHVEPVGKLQRLTTSATILVVALLFLAPTAAYASTPSRADIRRAEAIAHAKWKTNPRAWFAEGSVQCQLRYEVRSHPPGTRGGTVSWFSPTTCVIGFDPRADWSWLELCLTELHEYGHAALGPAFAAENPSDQWHTIDPASILNGRVPNAVDGKGCFEKRKVRRSRR